MAVKKMRRYSDASEMIDHLATMKNGQFCTICYVSAVKIGTTTQIRNPKTNRMNKVVDYDAVNKDLGTEGLTAIIALTRYYHLHWSNHEAMTKGYEKRKAEYDNIRQEFGMQPSKTRAGYQETNNFGSGISTGSTENTQGVVYPNQNLASGNCKRDTVYYGVNEQGDLIGEFTYDQIAKHIAKSNVDGLAELKKLTSDEKTLDSYVNRIKDLNSKFAWRSLRADRVVYIIGEDEYGYFYFVNTALTQSIDNQLVKSGEFVDMARKKYVDDYHIMQESVVKQGHILEFVGDALPKKPMINESLSNFIESVVRKAINEIGDTHKGQYMLGRAAARAQRRQGRKTGENNGLGYYNIGKSGEIGSYAEKKSKASNAKGSMDAHYHAGFSDEHANQDKIQEGYYDTATPEEVAQQFQNLRYHSFTAPDGSCELGFAYDPETNQLYAGYIFNAGINKEWVIDYDLDQSIDYNLQGLYDVIEQEGDWNYTEE